MNNLLKFKTHLAIINAFAILKTTAENGRNSSSLYMVWCYIAEKAFAVDGLWILHGARNFLCVYPLCKSRWQCQPGNTTQHLSKCPIWIWDPALDWNSCLKAAEVRFWVFRIPLIADKSAAAQNRAVASCEIGAQAHQARLPQPHHWQLRTELQIENQIEIELEIEFRSSGSSSAQ